MGVFRSLGNSPKFADGGRDTVPNRVGKFGEGYVHVPFITKHVQADEGKYFVVSNPTPGTAVASAVSASFSATAPMFILRNSDVTGGLRLYLDYIKILPTVAPASGTSMQVAIQHDTTNRYTSGGTGPTSGVNVNGDDGSASVGQLYYTSGGALLTAAAAGSSVRLVHRSTPRSTIPAVLDEIAIQFGGWADAGSSSGTTAGRSSSSGAPLIVAPQGSISVFIWFPSNAITGVSFEFEVAWSER